MTLSDFPFKNARKNSQFYSKGKFYCTKFALLQRRRHGVLSIAFITDVSLLN